MENPNFYAIIPANVRYDNELTANAKLLYGEITALCNSKGFCWATNDYFANLYGVSKTSISNWINALIKKGYITRELIYKEGSKEIANRCLKIFEGVPKKIGIPPQENFNTPPQKNFKDNNTIYNNTIYIKDIVEIVDYLNLKCNTKYKASTSKTQSMIRARIKEKFTVADFKKVIDIKAAEWGNDEKMKKYLRPETLFGTKFESYLNQAQVTNSYIPQTKQKEIDYNERQKSEAFYESIRQRDLEEAEKIRSSMSEEEYKAYVQSWTADL